MDVMTSHVATLLLVIMTVTIATTSQSNEYTGIYSTFPIFKKLPQTVGAAEAEGYAVRKECASPADEYGRIYSLEEARLLPGLIFNTHGQLSGMVFGVNRSQLLRPEEVSGILMLSKFHEVRKDV